MGHVLNVANWGILRNAVQIKTEEVAKRHLACAQNVKKGNHWANECRSAKNIHGQLISSSSRVTHPKNGQRGPRSQGPQIYGTINNRYPGDWPSLLHPRDHGEPLLAPPDWTYESQLH